MFLSFMPIASLSKPTEKLIHFLYSPIHYLMITSLQALRFIFALFILSEHYPLDINHPHLIEGAGAMGVSFFLVLSGFVMSVGYESRVQAESFSWSTFMLRRLIRLWPLHLLCLGTWIILAYAAWGSNAIYPLPLLGNALLLQWLPIEHIEGNLVAWCVSILVIFYAVYPLLARLKTTQLILLTLLIHIGLRLFADTVTGIDIRWYWYTFPGSRIQDFLIGILCYRSYKHIIKQYGDKYFNQLSIGYRWIIELFPMALCAWGLITLRANYTPLGSVMHFYLPCYLMILVFALSSTYPHKASIANLISRPWLIYLGEISFSFYMIHNLVILSVKQILSRIAPGIGWEPRLAITIGVTIGLSILISRYYETPIANYLSRRLISKG